MTYSNLIEPISPKESPAEFPDASVDGDDNTDGDIKCPSICPITVRQ